MPLGLIEDVPAPGPGGDIGPPAALQPLPDNGPHLDLDPEPPVNQPPVLPDQPLHCSPSPDMPLALRRPVRARKPPREWWLQHRKPTPAIDSDSDSESDGIQMAHFGDSAEPRSFADAMRRPDADKWREAAMEELQAHERNGTWSLVELPPGVKAIGGKWGLQDQV
ncbi:hypothetical protein SERLA73DRAFT_76038 [Serpula lacrymans var. lacrymans S7.3]|uniref:Reverse transcriptase Ty1/copia-type domain-containing protein n=1 Tax=Serpula lacrymans var. lacrymans (strain S7.3) TaxID=936435 RepID=F8Q601_SERL3|nr:hypothetical protein SERLA73DRAFT_76038 [Serpula lacrymans var. lacrymans S7.3]